MKRQFFESSRLTIPLQGPLDFWISGDCVTLGNIIYSNYSSVENPSIATKIKLEAQPNVFLDDIQYSFSHFDYI